MIKTMKYVAIDGQIFDTEGECRKYEEQLLAKDMVKYGIKAWKKEDTRYIPVLADYTGLTEAIFISVPTSEALHFLEQLGSDAGVEVPHDVGDWYFDAWREGWYNYSEYREAIEGFKFMEEQRQND